MSTIQGKRVSGSWGVVLAQAADDGVRFQLNSGRRTMGEQEALVRSKGLWSPSNPTGAARPNRNAPHIREGREDHALDVDTGNGGHRALGGWLVRHGVQVRFPIAKEPWHLEVLSEAALKRLASQLDDPLAGYPADERRWIRAYDRGPKLATRRALRRRMAKRAADIRAAAEHERGGWSKAHRRDRYRSLQARS